MAYSGKQMEGAWSKTGGFCWYCGDQLVKWSKFTVDRVIARDAGGTDAISNLVPACRPCNTLKGTKSVEEFRLKAARAPGTHSYISETWSICEG